ncbi:MAG TPA: S8 family serine peptidase [Solirubrobacteraceae bacterium]|nr:S8 family serine peptidase [Solirubrobacteraceae bacterium]
MKARPKLLIVALVAFGLVFAFASTAAAAKYRHGSILVGYGAPAGIASVGGAGPARVVRVPAEADSGAQLRRLRAEPDVRWAVRDYIAHTSSAPFVPDDPGLAHTPGGWAQAQWNLTGQYGVDAEEAWGNLIADREAGGRGVTVAVLDTGVAYANRGPYRRAPDFARRTFVQGYDFVSHNRYPNDRNGHGTFVAAEIAEQANNGVGLVGLAYGVKIMPVRVLNRLGEGEASEIAEGVYYAVRHGARVINMSLEFPPGVQASDIPELAEAVRYAHRRGVFVVAAAGNEHVATVDYPAHLPGVVAVGATTEHGCLAEYSNFGRGLTLVAPGGGGDMAVPDDSDCMPEGPLGRELLQVTFFGSLRHFTYSHGMEGTSMAAPEVSAAAAMVIASRVLGRHPSPAQITERLKQTAHKFGIPNEARYFGAGLLDAAAATAPRA